MSENPYQAPLVPSTPAKPKRRPRVVPVAAYLLSAILASLTIFMGLAVAFYSRGGASLLLEIAVIATMALGTVLLVGFAKAIRG